jgi:hypothetical protein
MDPLALGVVRRHLEADAIGNPQELLHKFDAVIAQLADLEPLIPKMREAQKIIAANEPDAEWKAHKGDLSPHEAEHVNFYFKNIYTFRYRVKFSLDGMKRVGAWALFLSIIQQYDLPPAIRKMIEAGSKFFAKSRVQAPDKSVAIDSYEKMLKTFRSFSLAAHEAIAHGKPRAGGADGDLAPEKIRAGPFTLINTGGFPKSTIAECAKVVEVAAHLLQSHGLGMVCYGDVLISNTLAKGNWLAFYVVGNDEMFVRANLKGKESAAIHTVTHELGHRLMYKFLKSKHREIEGIYNQISRKSSRATTDFLLQVWKDPALKPKVGDTLVSKGKEYTVTGFDVSSRGGIIVKLEASVVPVGHVLTEEEKRQIQTLGLVQRAKIDLESYAALKGILPKDRSHTGFVTGYAGKNASENFAEMVGFYCADKLPEDQVEMLKSVLA